MFAELEDEPLTPPGAANRRYQDGSGESSEQPDSKAAASGCRVAGLGSRFLQFSGRTGRWTNLLRQSFYPLLTRADLPHIRFHDLCHTAATLLLGRGIHPKIVSEMLDHSNISSPSTSTATSRRPCSARLYQHSTRCFVRSRLPATIRLLSALPRGPIVALWARLNFDFVGAGRGARTLKTLRSADFKSAAFACFAIPARFDSDRSSMIRDPFTANWYGYCINNASTLSAARRVAPTHTCARCKPSPYLRTTKSFHSRPGDRDSQLA